MLDPGVRDDVTERNLDLDTWTPLAAVAVRIVPLTGQAEAALGLPETTHLW